MTKLNVPTGIEKLRNLLMEEICIAKQIQAQLLKRLQQIEGFTDARFDKERQDINADVRRLQICVIETLGVAMNPPMPRARRGQKPKLIHQTTGNPNNEYVDSTTVDTGG